jgi:putative ABC transport system permease protein
MADIEKIRSIAERRNVNRVAPKLVEPVDVAGRRVLAVGVQWTEELGLKQWWKLVGRRPEGDHEVILGSRASSVLRLKPGQTLELSGESFVVAAALEPTGTQEDDLLFMDLGVAQRLWRRPGELSLIEVSAFCASCPIETINAQISAALPYARVSAVRTAVESREILLGQFRLFSLVLSALMLVVGCLIVLTATLSAVRDRRGEIGVFRAVGYRGRHILSIILVENVVLALAGGVVGIVVAALVADPLARMVAGVTTVVAPSPLGLLAALAVTVVVVLVAGLYPAWRAAQLSPLLAMREV